MIKTASAEQRMSYIHIFLEARLRLKKSLNETVSNLFELPSIEYMEMTYEVPFRHFVWFGTLRRNGSIALFTGQTEGNFRDALLMIYLKVISEMRF